MNRIIAAIAITAAFAAASLPALAAACSPAYRYDTAVTASDAPDCLQVEGVSAREYGTAQIVAVNDCDVPVELSCTGDWWCFVEGDEFVVQPGGRQVLSFTEGSAHGLAWSTEDGNGTIEYEITGAYASGACDSAFGCQAAPGQGSTGWLPIGFGLGLLGLVALRRLR